MSNKGTFFSTCENGDLEVVGQLYEKIQFQNKHALRCACLNGHLEVVKYLVEKGADFRTRDNDAVLFASQNGHLELVKYLVEKGADVRAYDNWAIRLASINGHLEVVEYLVEKGADFQAGDNYAVRRASQNGHFEIVKYLVEKGASDHRISEKARTYIRKCGINWSRLNHVSDFSTDTNKLFGAFFLGLQRLEETAQIPLSHQAMFEDMLEGWKIKDDYKLTGNIRV